MSIEPLTAAGAVGAAGAAAGAATALSSGAASDGAASDGVASDGAASDGAASDGAVRWGGFRWGGLRWGGLLNGCAAIDTILFGGDMEHWIQGNDRQQQQQGRRKKERNTFHGRALDFSGFEDRMPPLPKAKLKSIKKRRTTAAVRRWG